MKESSSFLMSKWSRFSYDKAGGVSTISITYSVDHANPPTPVAILGEDVAADANGRVYKLIRYPELGYWVAYIAAPLARPRSSP
jgi:hypothetical protein